MDVVRPEAMAVMPAFTGDNSDPADWSRPGGMEADPPQTPAFHPYAHDGGIAEASAPGRDPPAAGIRSLVFSLGT